MNIFRKAVLSVATATTTTLIVAVPTLAATFNQTLNFSTTNQSMWAEGAAAGFSNTTDLTTSWNTSGGIAPVTLIPGIPSVCIPFIGCTPGTDPVKSPGVTASTDGTIGFRNTFAVSGGSVNANIPINLSLLLPDSPVTAGSTFNLGTSFSLASNAAFQTFSPSISEELKLIFDVAANLNIAGVINPKFDVNATSTLFKIDNSSLSANLLDNNYGSVDVKVPTVNTTGTVQAGSPNLLSSSGSDTFANGTLKIANIASGLLGLPPLSGGDSFGIGPVSIGYNYNLLTANGTLDLAAVQNFALKINQLPAVLSFLLDDSTSSAPISFNVGDTLSLVAPTNWSGKATAAIDLNALFSNNTGIQFIPGFDISALGLGLNLPLGLGNPSLGPLFSVSKQFPTSPINVYNNNFALGGFNSQLVNFHVAVAGSGNPGNGGNPGGGGTTSIPEPFSAFGILTFGILGAATTRRRAVLVRAKS